MEPPQFFYHRCRGALLCDPGSLAVKEPVLEASIQAGLMAIIVEQHSVDVGLRQGRKARGKLFSVQAAINMFIQNVFDPDAVAAQPNRIRIAEIKILGEFLRGGDKVGGARLCNSRRRSDVTHPYQLAAKFGIALYDLDQEVSDGLFQFFSIVHA